MQFALVLVAALALPWFATGCAPSSPTPSVASAQPRIVSLSPALTDTVTELGAADFMVGRTPWCDAPGAAVVGSLHDADLERIRLLKPTLIMVQAREVDPGLRALAEQCGAELFVRHITTLDDIVESVTALGATLEKQGLKQAGDRAAAIVAGVPGGGTNPTSSGAAPHAGGALLLFAVDPPMAFGSDTYVVEMWERAGGRNALKRPGYPELTLEDIVQLDPAEVIFIGSGKRTDQLATLPERFHGRLQSVNASWFLQPSARVLSKGPALMKAIVDGTHDAGATP